MHVYGNGKPRIGSQFAPTNVAPRNKKAGWWVLGPAVWGAFFFLLGIVLVGGGASVPAASGSLYLTGGIFLVMGLGALVFAWFVRKDITSDDGPKLLPAALPAEHELVVRATGVPGSATVKEFKFLGGSHEGSTVVEVQLDVTTARGGTVSITSQTRVPLTVTDKLAAGATVPVRVSPSDPNDLVFDWPALVSA